MGILSKIFSSKKLELQNDSNDVVEQKNKDVQQVEEQQVSQKPQKNPEPSPFLSDEDITQKNNVR